MAKKTRRATILSKYLLLIVNYVLDVATEYNNIEKKQAILQLKKDVDRSFNTCFEELTKIESDKQQYRNKLQTLLEIIFIHCQDQASLKDASTEFITLHYYQGFNTICSVFLILQPNPNNLRPLIHNFSYNFLLDHLSPNFENTLVWLDLIGVLLKKCNFGFFKSYFLGDPILYEVFEKLQMGFHFAMPWIITWFSHSLVDFEAVVLFFDFFMRKHPIFVVYTVVSLLTNQNIRTNILNEFSRTNDMAEVYGRIQYSAKLIYANLSVKKEKKKKEERELIYVRDLINDSVALEKRFKIDELLSSKTASKLSDDSILWRKIYFQELDEPSQT